MQLDDLEKGDSKTYYCDVCPNKKPNKGATEEGAKTSTICHLAIQHHELRPFVEKDDALEKEFISELYYVRSLHNLYHQTKSFIFKFFLTRM